MLLVTPTTGTGRRGRVRQPMATRRPPTSTMPERSLWLYALTPRQRAVGRCDAIVIDVRDLDTDPLAATSPSS